MAGYDKWVRIYTPVHRGWCITSNLAESINTALVSACEFPVFDFLEEVYLMFGRWNLENQKEPTYTFTLLMGIYQDILMKNELKSISITVVPSSVDVHNVCDEGKRFIVCLANKTCSCGRFQIEEIPCEHMWTVLKFKHIEPDYYCSDLYKAKIVLKTCEVPICPLPDISDWVATDNVLDDVVLPPVLKRPLGRPKKKSRDKLFSELQAAKGKKHATCVGWLDIIIALVEIDSVLRDIML